MNQDIIDQGFKYVNDPFLGEGYASTEKFIKHSRNGFSGILMLYEDYKWFIHKSIYTGLWNIIYMPTGHQENVVNIVNIKEKFEEMKKNYDML